MFLEASFRGQKTGYKPCLGRVLKAFSYHFNFLPWSDPQPQGEIIRARDLASINDEFERALRNMETNPREAISAACNVLESVCKTYIEDEGLEMPKKKDLQSVWNVVRKDLGFDPSNIEDRDLQEILSGLLAVVNGVGALRTHGSSAHGQGRLRYRLQARHARLAIHAAHTIAAFVIESWDYKRVRPTS
ncbi:MAG: abortive infection family protein [Desulfatiglandales bacterium]